MFDSKVHVLDHPLLQHKLSILRDERTGVKEFREIVSEIATLECYEATRDLPLEDVEIKTPVATGTFKCLTGKKLAIVPILRAGLGMVDGILTLIPSAKVGHIGLYRDPETLAPVEYYCKMPHDIAERDVIVLDPMLATGGSAVAAETPMVHVEVAADEGTATESWVQVPAFSRIEVELDMGNVSVMPTGEYDLSFSGEHATLLDYEMDGDTLRITGTALSAMEFFTSGDEAAVTIGIPEDASLDAVDIHTAMGQVELGGFTANSLTVSTDLGNVSLDSVMASDADITLSMGDLTGYSLTTTDSLTVKNDMGDVYLDGDFQGNTDITLSMGDLDLTTWQSLDTYSLDLDVTMGDLYLDGSTQYGSVRREGGPNQLKIANSMGSADVYFG